ncbi:hypothetical protein QOV31_005252 (plasmid) [Agrobacterium fabrum]|uniref:Ornithine cyclodeaminase n=2 Tax=Catharanthus roseus TaxID=4058 RepID=C6YBB5_CATRO|nr:MULTISPECIES: hypothetical protein [Rhizobium/Agrobacterium group]ABI54194.1 hypothetical protein [Catharanthus roseus]KEA04438.1 hypothetical protein CN09_19040 [Rhizobium rhizogenes]NMV72558.1 hypothetical protein [Agrobacterium fabrum]NTI85377.1 hypothetical protein [Rhizobium rhizogenes]NTJ27560.1 hypothetical protein [Rhizobium rhizogenes]
MAKQLCEVHWTESALSNLDIQITPAFVDEALKSYWEVFAAGKAGHVKAYLTFNKNVPGWTEGALIGYFGRYSGTKDIHFAPTNAATGKPLQHSDIFLRDKVSGTLLMSVEGVAISNGRTGWFSLACVNLLLQGREDIDVFLFGAGKVAEAVILSLNYGAAKRIRKVAVLSRGKKSNFELVEKLRDCVTFSLEAVGDRSLLPYSQFVIMATNYGKPVFEAAEIAPNAVTLSLGIDDMPPDYIEHVLSADGLIVADDLVAMEARNVDAVALYYSRRGMKLTQHGKRDGIKNYTEILDDEALMNDLKAWKGPANFSPVGLASIDVAVAAHVYETLLNKLAGPMEHGH